MSEDWQESLDPSDRALLRRKGQPRHVAPMLATLTVIGFIMLARSAPVSMTRSFRRCIKS